MTKLKRYFVGTRHGEFAVMDREPYYTVVSGARNEAVIMASCDTHENAKIIVRLLNEASCD